MMYESPIMAMVKDITTEMRQEQDREIMNAILSVGISADKDELVKALRYDRQQYDKGYSEGYADAIEELESYCKELESQATKWISVEERLPHYLDHVLCVNKFGIQMVGYLTDYKEGGFRCESGMDSCDYITHWMPLPVPPKEDKL